MSAVSLTREHHRRRGLRLGVTGRWTFAHRAELKHRGFLWDGECWLAPSEEVRDRARADLQGKEAVEEWSLTVHGDAGWKDGIGRWAWFCRSALPPRLLEGAEQGECPNSTVAEARALLWGVRAALARWPVPEPPAPATLYLRSDSKSVIDAITARSARLDEVGQILSHLPPRLTVNAKHVPGHRKGGTAAWVNDRVDRASNLRGEVGDRRLKR